MMEDPKNGKDDEKKKESPELKKELTEDEPKVVSGGLGGTAFANDPNDVSGSCSGAMV